jgi:hypothetical protein
VGISHGGSFSAGIWPSVLSLCVSSVVKLIGPCEEGGVYQL